MRKPDPQQTKYFGEKVAAEYLSYSVSALQKMRVKGTGPVFYKRMGKCLYTYEDLDAWMNQHRFSSTSQVRKVNDA